MWRKIYTYAHTHRATQTHAGLPWGQLCLISVSWQHLLELECGSRQKADCPRSPGGTIQAPVGLRVFTTHWSQAHTLLLISAPCRVGLQMLREITLEKLGEQGMPLMKTPPKFKSPYLPEHLDKFPLSSSFSSGSDGKESACNAGDLGSVPGLGRFPGEGNGYPLQYSFWENPVDRGAWWAAVHGVVKRWTQLSDYNLTFHEVPRRPRVNH